ncbi:MAG: sugar-binding protein [Anaerolineales bacterium]
MARRAQVLSLIFVFVAVLACTLPGAAPPTPFSFPLPNLTMTAIFGTAMQDPSTPPTIPEIQVTELTATEGPSPTTSASDTPEPPTSTPTRTPTPLSPTATGVVPTPTTSSAPTARPNGVTINATKLSTPPTIDAVLTEWTSNVFSANSIVYGAFAWTGSSDLSATCYTGWDSTNLYLALSITDDTFVQISSGVYMYRGDSVELQFDKDLQGDFYSTSQTSDDTQLGFSPGNFNGLSPEAYRWYPTSLSGPLSSVTVASRKTTQGYDMEIKIPWTTFGITPIAGTRFGFALSVSDNDQVGIAVQESMVSSVSTRQWGDPTTWGTLYLAP